MKSESVFMLSWHNLYLTRLKVSVLHIELNVTVIVMMHAFDKCGYLLVRHLYSCDYPLQRWIRISNSVITGRY